MLETILVKFKVELPQALRPGITADTSSAAEIPTTAPVMQRIDSIDRNKILKRKTRPNPPATKETTQPLRQEEEKIISATNKCRRSGDDTNGIKERRISAE